MKSMNSKIKCTFKNHQISQKWLCWSACLLLSLFSFYGCEDEGSISSREMQAGEAIDINGGDAAGDEAGDAAGSTLINSVTY